MSAAAERMQDLIDDLLRFSRVATQGRPFEPVDLERVAARGARRPRGWPSPKPGRACRLDDLPTIEADPLQMRQLLQNLISNALKFRRDGVVPEVWVTARPTTATLTITVVATTASASSSSTPTRSSASSSACTAAAPTRAPGSGWPSCRKIAERHGGTIAADGAPGEGATFTVTLPVNSQDDSRTRRPDAATHEAEHAPLCRCLTRTRASRS